MSQVLVLAKILEGKLQELKSAYDKTYHNATLRSWPEWPSDIPNERCWEEWYHWLECEVEMLMDFYSEELGEITSKNVKIAQLGRNGATFVPYNADTFSTYFQTYKTYIVAPWDLYLTGYMWGECLVQDIADGSDDTPDTQDLEMWIKEATAWTQALEYLNSDLRSLTAKAADSYNEYMETSGRYDEIREELKNEQA